MRQKLKDVCEFYSGTGFPLKYQGEESGELPFYKVGDIAANVSAGKIHLELCNNYVSYDIAKEIKGCILPENVIIFAKIGEALKLNRRAITSCKCLIDNNAMGISAKEHLLRTKYFFYFMKHMKMETLSESTTVPSVRKSKLENVEIDIPNLIEQEEIESRLDKISAIITHRRQQLSKLDQLVKARFVEMFGDPVTNPKRLPISLLGELSELITKGASPSWQGFSYTDDDTQTLFVTSENVREGYIDLSSPKYIEDGFNEKQKRSVLKKGDFLINIVGASIGRVAQFNLERKANINQAAALVRINNAIVRDKYLLIYLNSNKAQQMYNSMKSDTGRANLSLQDISNLSILLPPIEQQIEFEHFIEQVEKVKSKVKESLDKAQTLFDSLMQEYFG